MADQCLFCKRLVYKNKVCENHYSIYEEQKDNLLKYERRKIEFKQYYHNLRHGIYKFMDYKVIVELCLKLMALADIYFELYNEDALVKVVLTDVNKIIRTKVNQIKESRDVMMNRYSTMFNDIDFRKKWKCDIRTEDGHYVRSRAEQVIDNYLYNHGIVHCYEKLIILDREYESTLLSDFYIPEIDLYIEYYGKYDSEYFARKNAKDQIYRENNLNYIALGQKDLDNLDDVLLKVIITRRAQVQKKGQL